MPEEERGFEVTAGFTLPDLGSCRPEGGRLVTRPPAKLKTTYLDTADLRLARAGATLCFRRGDDEPWLVELPTGARPTRVPAAGPASTVPERLLELVTVFSRGAALAPVTTLSTLRSTQQLCDRDDRVVVEVIDDAVSATGAGRRSPLKFRQISVVRRAGKARIADAVEAALRDAGATAAGLAPAHLRALGDAARRPADWPTPAARLPHHPTAAQVVTAALQADVARIVAHDPLVRLRAGVGPDDTAVHQLRVGCRRLRSDLRTFAPLLDPEWVTGLRAEVGWIAAQLGAARDAEVLRARLRTTAATDPLAPLDDAALARIDADLAVRQEDALAALDKAMTEPRYHRLLDALLVAATAPQLTPAADEPASAALPPLVRRPWRHLAYGGDGVPGAGHLDAGASDQSWHAVRVNGKRARYAVEAVATALGGEAAELASALATVQDLLGEHQDAAVAALTWLAVANADPDDHALAVTAGRLYERERAATRAARAAFPAAWKAAAKRRLTEWLH